MKKILLKLYHVFYQVFIGPFLLIHAKILSLRMLLKGTDSPVVRLCAHSLVGVAQSLAGELRSCIPHGVANIYILLGLHRILYMYGHWWIYIYIYILNVILP